MLVLEFAPSTARAYLTTHIGQGVMPISAMEIFARLQRLTIPFFDRHPVGRLMTRVTSDVETLNELFSSGVVAIFGDLFTLLAIIVIDAVDRLAAGAGRVRGHPAGLADRRTSSGGRCARPSATSGSGSPG